MKFTLSLIVQFQFFIILVLINIHVSSSNPYSGHISHSTKKTSHNHQPLILVLDNSHLKKASSKSNEYQDSKEDNGLTLSLLINQLLKQAHDRKPVSKFWKPKHHKNEISDRKPRPRHSLEKRPRAHEDYQSFNKDDNISDHVHSGEKHHHHDERHDRSHQDNTRSEDGHQHSDHDKKEHKGQKVHHSPVIKNLLRISNSLRCGARNQCEDECSKKYNGKKVDECEDKCEENISCEEEESDECADDECATSGEENISTKGVTFTTTTPKCKRC